MSKNLTKILCKISPISFLFQSYTIFSFLSMLENSQFSCSISAKLLDQNRQIHFDKLTASASANVGNVWICQSRLATFGATFRPKFGLKSGRKSAIFWPQKHLFDIGVKIVDHPIRPWSPFLDFLLSIETILNLVICKSRLTYWHRVKWCSVARKETILNNPIVPTVFAVETLRNA